MDGSNCARRTDGTVVLGGANWALGDGSTAERGTPAPVPGLSGIRRVWGRDRSFLRVTRRCRPVVLGRLPRPLGGAGAAARAGRLGAP